MEPSEEKAHRELRKEQLKADGEKWPTIGATLSARQQARINEFCKRLENALNAADGKAGG